MRTGSHPIPDRRPLQRRASFKTRKGRCSTLSFCIILSLNRFQFKELCSSRRRLTNGAAAKSVNYLPLSRTIVRGMPDLGPMHAPQFAPNIVVTLMAAFPSRRSHDFR